MSNEQNVRLFTINRAAAAFGISTYLLRMACKDGRLRHVRSGVKILIHEDSLKEFLKGQ